MVRKTAYVALWAFVVAAGLSAASVGLAWVDDAVGPLWHGVVVLGALTGGLALLVWDEAL